MVDMLRERGAGHIRVFGGGGGTITPEEIAELQAYGVERIYHPNDGMHLGLVGDDRGRGRARAGAGAALPTSSGRPQVDIDDEIAIGRDALGDRGRRARRRRARRSLRKRVAARRRARRPVVGITGTGGAGKSSVTDELLCASCQRSREMRIAVLAVDPTRRRTGGALLGDRIRMNSLRNERVYMRSMATRRQNAGDQRRARRTASRSCKPPGFDLVIVETAGIGQRDSEIVDLVDFPMYVMTSEFGAASQLEKIDMLDFAELVVINKFDKRGAEDALRDVRKQWKRNRVAFELAEDEDVPVYPTIASQFNDPGITWMFVNLCRLLRDKLRGCRADERLDAATRHRARTRAARHRADPRRARALPRRDRRAGPRRSTPRSNAGRDRRPRAASADRRCEALGDAELPQARSSCIPTARRCRGRRRAEHATLTLRQRYNDALEALGAEALKLLRDWPARLEVDHRRVTYTTGPRQGDHRSRTTASRSVAPEDPEDRAAHATTAGASCCASCMKENLPGYYPYTGGVFPYRRTGEDPTRMFAGEGTPERTNRRFHYLASGQPAARLSTAFDSRHAVRRGPAPRPDIYGKVGNSGVIDRHARRREEAVLRLRPVRADDLGVDDDQRPGADDPRVLHEHRDRPAGREAPARDRRAGTRRSDKIDAALRRPAAPALRGRAARRATTASASACSASPATRSSTPRPTRGSRRDTLHDRARHRAGRHPQGGPGAEHLHLLAPSSR